MAKLMGGALIRNRRAPDHCGTLACTVRKRGDPQSRFLLTAAHVIGLNGYANHGDAVEAFLYDEQRWVKIAEFESAVNFHDADGVLQVCDAAIARLTGADLVSDEIEGVGLPDEVATGLFQGMNLKFRGAGSRRVVEAQVHSTGNVVPVSYRNVASGGMFSLRFRDQILYGRAAGGILAPATQPMDSGSLILNSDGMPVGLHVGRTPFDYPIAASICSPLRSVLDALNIELIPRPTAAGAPPPPPLDADSLGERSFAMFRGSVRSLLEPHNMFGGVSWQLCRDGVVVGGRLDRSPGRLVTVPRVWRDFGPKICAAALRHGVPLELIVATICTETSGRADAVRIEPGWVSDTKTPQKISVGLMQTLISTARQALDKPALNRHALLDPGTSIDAGTAYINQQRNQTNLDPPLVACAYNAGRLAANAGASNRWKMRQFPIDTGAHADRFVQWFNDCCAFFNAEPTQLPHDAPSFCRLFGRGSQ